MSDRRRQSAPSFLFPRMSGLHRYSTAPSTFSDVSTGSSQQGPSTTFAPIAGTENDLPTCSSSSTNRDAEEIQPEEPSSSVKENEEHEPSLPLASSTNIGEEHRQLTSDVVNENDRLAEPSSASAGKSTGPRPIRANEERPQSPPSSSAVNMCPHCGRLEPLSLRSNLSTDCRCRSERQSSSTIWSIASARGGQLRPRLMYKASTLLDQSSSAPLIREPRPAPAGSTSFPGVYPRSRLEEQPSITGKGKEPAHSEEPSSPAEPSSSADMSTSQGHSAQPSSSTGMTSDNGLQTALTTFTPEGSSAEVQTRTPRPLSTIIVTEPLTGPPSPSPAGELAPLMHNPETDTEMQTLDPQGSTPPPFAEVVNERRPPAYFDVQRGDEFVDGLNSEGVSRRVRGRKLSIDQTCCDHCCNQGLANLMDACCCASM